MTNNNRVVIVAPNWLGDAVMALPAVADVRRHFPEAHLGVAARASVAPLFDMVGGINDVVRLPGRGGLGALTTWQDDAAAIKAGGYDTALLLPNSFASALIASRAAVAERWGYAADFRGRYLTRAIPKPAAPLHQAAYYQALVSGLGIPNGPLHARVVADAERGRALVREIGLDPDEPFVVFAPGAAYGRAKQWLPERFVELGDLIVRERGWGVLLAGSGADRPVCGQIAAKLARSGTRLNRAVDLSGKTDLRSLAALLSVSHAVVANDSGAMHLAGAVGATVVAVFGATNEARTSPLSSGPDSPAPVIITHQVFCRPCMLRECPIDHRCMRGITARRVFDAVIKN
ncbi:MAG: lipopolysaccharide heptosyltransferase II [Vicinamibacterales bacterium]